MKYAPLKDDAWVPLEDVLSDVGEEVVTALDRFPSLNSPHEGWAVIKEEMDELWEEVKANRGRGEDALYEAKQVAAMAVRYILDLREGER